MSESENNHRPRVAREKHKASDKARCDRSKLVETVAKNSEIWSSSKEIQSAGEALIAAGEDLAARELKVRSLLAQVASARKEVVTARVRWNGRFEVYASNAELIARKPEDLANLALIALEKAVNHLAPPIAVKVTFNRKTRLIHIVVHQPPGRAHCRIELSPDPVTPDSFKALEGGGARRALAGYPLGRWWVRALMYDTENESAYSPLVCVEVS
jgi:hypothetical protein